MKPILPLLAALMLLPTALQAVPDKKDKKPKAEYVWDWDGKRSGDKIFDEYLTSVNDLWKEMQSYAETFAIYTYHEDTLTIADRYYIMAYMTDPEGNYLTRGTVGWQLVESVSTSALIVTDATLAAAETISATAELPNLGLDAFTFGKYIKGGPQVINKGMKEMKTVWAISRGNAKSWKALKNGAVDPETLNYFSDDAIKLIRRCCYIKEIVQTDKAYEQVMKRQIAKTEEELAQEAALLASNLENGITLPEDASKTLDDISDDALDRELEL